jgi:hypothetical protein
MSNIASLYRVIINFSPLLSLFWGIRGLLKQIWYYIATASAVRTFLIPETLDSTTFFP